MLGSSFCGQEVTAKQAKHSYIIHVFFGGPPEFLHSWTPKQSFLDDFRKGGLGSVGFASLRDSQVRPAKGQLSQHSQLLCFSLL